MCEIARTSGKNIHPLKKDILRSDTKSEQAILKQCQKCFSYIGKGREHKCDRNTKRENLEELVKSSSEKSQNRIVTTGLKQVVKDAGVSKKGGKVELSTNKGKAPYN